MDIDIKKKYVMSKQNSYGIENESQIILQIKRSIRELLKEE